MSRRGKKREKPSLQGKELVFVFKNPSVKCLFQEGSCRKSDLERVQRILSVMSETIMLDRTYVKTEDTPYKDAFITKEGWNELSDIVRQLEEGAVRTTKTVAQNLDLAYRILIIEYLTVILESFGYDPETFTLDVNQIKPVEVEIQPDVCEEWKYRKKN